MNSNDLMHTVSEEMEYLAYVERIDRLFDWNESAIESNEASIIDFNQVSDAELMELCGLLDEPLI